MLSLSDFPDAKTVNGSIVFTLYRRACIFFYFFFLNDFRVILIFVVHHFEKKKLAWRIGFSDQNKLFLAMCESDIIKDWPFNVYVWAPSEWSFIENRLLCLVFRKISQRSCHFHYNGCHAHILKRKVINNVITAIFDQWFVNYDHFKILTKKWFASVKVATQVNKRLGWKNCRCTLYCKLSSVAVFTFFFHFLPYYYCLLFSTESLKFRLCFELTSRLSSLVDHLNCIARSFVSRPR